MLCSVCNGDAVQNSGWPGARKLKGHWTSRHCDGQRKTVHSMPMQELLAALGLLCQLQRACFTRALTESAEPRLPHRYPAAGLHILKALSTEIAQKQTWITLCCCTTST